MAPKSYTIMLGMRGDVRPSTLGRLGKRTEKLRAVFRDIAHVRYLVVDGRLKDAGVVQARFARLVGELGTSLRAHEEVRRRAQKAGWLESVAKWAHFAMSEGGFKTELARIVADMCSITPESLRESDRFVRALVNVAMPRFEVGHFDPAALGLPRPRLWKTKPTLGSGAARAALVTIFDEEFGL